MNYLAQWFKRHFTDPQVVILLVILASIGAAVLFFGNILAPLLAAIVIAYLLQSIVGRLDQLRVPHWVSVLIVFVGFLATLFLAVFGLLPPLFSQLKELLQQVPQMLSEAQRLLMQLPEQYPQLFTSAQVSEIVATVRAELLSFSQKVLSFSVSSVVTLFTIAVYLVIVPLLVFFLVRDRQKIIDWFVRFLPKERQLTDRVWVEVNSQIGNYVRGKIWEIFIIGAVSYAMFELLGLQYALLLGALTGLSVVVPYVGAVVVSVPVATIAFFQWGLGADFYYAVLGYAVLQALDGNLLAPLLFSEVVDLHPVAIIVAILFFGGVWGFWGVFFAIPLATVIQAVLRAWPTLPPEQTSSAPASGGGHEPEQSASVREAGQA